jgi:hypothetical protein
MMKRPPWGWRETVFLILAGGLFYPSIALLGLLQAAWIADPVMPSIDAYISKRYLFVDLAWDWLAALPWGGLLSLGVLSLVVWGRKIGAGGAVLVLNLLWIAVLLFLFGMHFHLFLAPLLYANLVMGIGLSTVFRGREIS